MMQIVNGLGIAWTLSSSIQVKKVTWIQFDAEEESFFDDAREDLSKEEIQEEINTNHVVEPEPAKQ